VSGKQEVDMQINIQHDDWLYQKLQDAEFAAEYLNAASEDDDPKTYLAALRKVAEARGGMAHVAQIAGVSRQTLYRMLSTRGNPTFKTLSVVLKATGLKIAVSPH
jgi:probable addiction module antidote protein